MNVNPTLLRTGTALPKALQAELDAMGAAYTCGLCDDPTADARSMFHIFRPAATEVRVATVLFHGTGNDALFCWESLILDLLKSGRAVLGFDLPGHGQGSSTRLDEASFGSSAAFLPELLKKFLPTVETTEAIGYSLGALAALHHVQRSALPWQALVLMALPERVRLTAGFFVGEGLSFLSKVWWQQLKGFGWDASFPAFGMVRRARFPIRLEPGLRMSYPAFVGQLLGRSPVLPLLSSLSIPILLLYGARDSLATAAYGKSLGRECVVIQGANHFLLPLVQETRKTILSWLTSQQHPAANSIPR